MRTPIVAGNWKMFKTVAQANELVAAAKALPAGVVVMTPYFMEPLRADKMRARMDEYGAAAKRVAAAHNARLVDTQALFDRLFEDCYTARISWDRVHPNLAGHMLLVTFSTLAAALFVKNFTVIFLPLPAFAMIFFTAFEVLVSVLQAYVFTLLLAVYIGLSVHADH